MNGDTIVEFLKEVRKRHAKGKRIHLILDCAGYNKAKRVKKKAKELNIKLHYLPPYSPNLNPIERLWKVMNELTRNNTFFSSTKEFRDRIDDFIAVKWQQVGNSYINRINDNFQTLYPASSS